jgi:hypothetical protein
MKLVIIQIFKNLIGMLISKHMIFWALELAAKQTSNKVDDNLLGLVRGAYDNDVDKVKESAEALLENLK